MKDVALTLDLGESIQIYFYQNKRSGMVFVWQEDEDKVAVSINIDGAERFVVEITNEGKTIEVIKDKQR